MVILSRLIYLCNRAARRETMRDVKHWKMLVVPHVHPILFHIPHPGTQAERIACPAMSCSMSAAV